MCVGLGLGYITDMSYMELGYITDMSYMELDCIC
jgi:hypothetical protein